MNTTNIQFTLQDIYELHAQLESAFVLSPGVRDENLLASADPLSNLYGERSIPIHLR